MLPRTFLHTMGELFYEWDDLDAAGGTSGKSLTSVNNSIRPGWREQDRNGLLAVERLAPSSIVAQQNQHLLE